MTQLVSLQEAGDAPCAFCGACRARSHAEDWAWQHNFGVVVGDEGTPRLVLCFPCADQVARGVQWLILMRSFGLLRAKREYLNAQLLLGPRGRARPSGHDSVSSRLEDREPSIDPLSAEYEATERGLREQVPPDIREQVDELLAIPVVENLRAPLPDHVLARRDQLRARKAKAAGTPQEAEGEAELALLYRVMDAYRILPDLQRKVQLFSERRRTLLRLIDECVERGHDPCWLYEPLHATADSLFSYSRNELAKAERLLAEHQPLLAPLETDDA